MRDVAMSCLMLPGRSVQLCNRFFSAAVIFEELSGIATTNSCDLGMFVRMSVSKKCKSSNPTATIFQVNTLVMGAIFGCIFGIMDVEDAGRYQMRLTLLKEEQ